MKQTYSNENAETASWYIRDGMGEVERNIKRIIDFLVALLCVIVFSPLFLACYIAIKREDGGPAIYKQERIGRFGRPFYIYKFRSMRVDAEKEGPALYHQDGDPRLTKVGKFLREHHRKNAATVAPRPFLFAAPLALVRHADSLYDFPQHRLWKKVLVKKE